MLISKESEFNLLDDVLWNFVFTKSLAQVVPIHLEVLLFNRHVLVERVHIRPLIIIRATEFSDQVKGHSVVELRDVAHILQPKCIKSVVGQSMLVKLGHNQTQLLLTSHLINEPLLWHVFIFSAKILLSEDLIFYWRIEHSLLLYLNESNSIIISLIFHIWQLKIFVQIFASFYSITT